MKDYASTDEMPKVLSLGFFGNVWIRLLRFLQAGDIYYGHTHQHDHMSLLTKGSVKVRVKDQWTTYEAPAFVEIHKQDEHEIIALEDDTHWWCVFAVRDELGQIVEQVNPAIHDPLKFSL